ncbi:MAG: RluA family pseudouridine synthase [Alicyclobacillus sp.]|nr:RluA family pseudouridine synthase [Alicyclobacillus sp.]
MIEVTVGPVEAGKKVHRYVRQLLPGVPLSGIYKMIRTGRIKRNGRKTKADDVVQAGDVIRLYMAEEDFAEVSKPVKKFAGVPRRIDVVYEDADLLVVNKPAGLLVHGAAGEFKDTLVNRVLAHLHHKGELDQRVFTPAPVNRLDRNTSGLVLFGKHGEAIRTLASDLAAHRIRKWYVAIVAGQTGERGEISAPLQRSARGDRTVIAEQGAAEAKAALTRYVRLAEGRGTSVIGVELVHGRTHQIRAHLAHAGHPLVGDGKYGGPRVWSTVIPHYQLHAAWLELADGRRFQAPLPQGFCDALARLGFSPARVAEQLVTLPDTFG